MRAQHQCCFIRQRCAASNVERQLLYLAEWEQHAELEYEAGRTVDHVTAVPFNTAAAAA